MDGYEVEAQQRDCQPLLGVVEDANDVEKIPQRKYTTKTG